MEIEQPSAKHAAITAEGQEKPVYGKPTYDGVIAGKVSGRKWKQESFIKNRDKDSCLNSLSECSKEPDLGSGPKA
ncbi:hypothetical protein SUGI_0760330 [Cryptomeria japonica]|nr:hypothetical protein SUGI_0760330 [Cryptomeria japonica]